MKTSARLRCFLLASVLALASLLPFLSACHGARSLPAFSVPETFDADRTYEISFWAKNDTNKTQTDIYRKAIEDFQALYPNIHVSLRLYTDYGKIYNDVITNIPTNTTPNVCITYPDHIATYMTGNNVMVPLNGLMDDPEYGLHGARLAFDGPTKEEIFSQFLNECLFPDGNYYALPFMRSTEACYINKTFVEKMGFTVPDIVTWDWIWQVSEAALAKDADGRYAVSGTTAMIPFIYKSTDNMMIQMLKQLDAPFSTSDGDILVFNDDTRSVLRTVSEHARSGAFSTFKISSYPANSMNRGECILAVDSTAGATWMGADAPLTHIPDEEKVEFETVLRPVPCFSEDRLRMISQGPSVCLLNKEDPQEVLASWLFLQFLLSNDVQVAYSQTEGYVPVTSKAQYSDAYQDYLSREGEDGDLHYALKIQAAKLLLSHLDDTFITPVFNGSASLRNAAGDLIENVVASEQRGHPVSDEDIERFFVNMRKLHHLDQVQVSGQKKQDFGALPGTAVALLIGVCVAWAGIAVYFFIGKAKEKKASTGKR
ncbi:MAG: extracellular solute-binding protein [Clostridia bacterium]|nr:extracellular solute-binding protein [Clostridia bacterium]